MSRKLVLVSVFLAVLPVLLVALKARGDDPPKKAGGTPAPQRAPRTIIRLVTVRQAGPIEAARS